MPHPLSTCLEVKSYCSLNPRHLTSTSLEAMFIQTITVRYSRIRNEACSICPLQFCFQRSFHPLQPSPFSFLRKKTKQTNIIYKYVLPMVHLSFSLKRLQSDSTTGLSQRLKSISLRKRLTVCSRHCHKVKEVAIRNKVIGNGSVKKLVVSSYSLC